MVGIVRVRVGVGRQCMSMCVHVCECGSVRGEAARDEGRWARRSCCVDSSARPLHPMYAARGTIDAVPV